MHSCAGRNPVQDRLVSWIPAFAGMKTGLPVRLTSIRADQTSAEASLLNKMGDTTGTLRDIQPAQALGIQVSQAYLRRLQEM